MGESGALLGRVVAGKFRIEELVGSGAMGEVFRARHVVLDTIIALKIMRPDIAKDAMFKERFYREAKAASRLDHPNSVRVLDFGVEPDGLVYLAMEFLHGRDLLAVLRDDWPLPDERIIDIVLQALAAVAVAHDLGIIHRDLKPENIMVSVGADDDGARPYHVKVCDFGIAKLNDPRGFQTDSGKALTSSGTLIGTPEYMSPEQARGDTLDARSDLYSMGIVLYQLLVGKVPFSAENALGVVLKQVTDEPIPPSKARPGVNARLEAICLRALKKPRDERYQSAKDMRRDLKGVFNYGARTSDESGPHIPAAMPRGGVDVSNAPTMIQQPEASLSSGDTGSTLVDPVVRRKLSAGIDFSPKGTSDGTELTVSATPRGRYIGAIIAVASMALLVGAGVVFLVSRSADAKKAQLAAAGASAAIAADSASIAANAASAAAGPTPTDGTTEPTTLPPTALGGPVGTQGKRGSVTGKPSASAARGLASSQGVGGPLATTATTGAGGATGAASSARAVASGGATPAVAGTGTGAAYDAAGAYVALGALTRERVREDVIRGKMSAALPKLSECYRSAVMMAGSPVGGSAQIHMSIDDKGNMTAMVSAPKLPQFARCAQGALVGQKVPVSALEDVSMGANASQWLDLHP